MADDNMKKPELLAIKRGGVTINATQKTPVIYTATEGVTWNTGQAQINGVGVNRHAAIDALEDSYNKLKEVLAVAE